MSRKWKNDADWIDKATEEPTRSMRGMDTLVEAIRYEAWEEFPMNISEVNYSFGDIEIEDGSGGYVPVRDLTEHVDRPSFTSPDDLLAGLSHALESWKGVHVEMEHLKRPEDQIAS